MTRPLLLLDVDDPLNPWAAPTPPPRHVEHRFRVSRRAGPFAQSRLGWKFPAVAQFACGRPLAWLDGDFGLRPVARDRFLGERSADGTPDSRT